MATPKTGCKKCHESHSGTSEECRAWESRHVCPLRRAVLYAIADALVAHEGTLDDAREVANLFPRAEYVYLMEQYIELLPQ